MYRYALLNESKAYQGASITKAVKYYNRLANKPAAEADENNTDAMINLGILYCEGDGIARDAYNGRKLIEQALKLCSEKNLCINAYSIYRIGVLYCGGKINPSGDSKRDDLQKGVSLLDIAIKDGLDGFHPYNMTYAKELCAIANQRIGFMSNRDRLIKHFKKIADRAAQEEAARRKSQAEQQPERFSQQQRDV